MRILLTAFALTFALPAAAQTLPAQPHQPSGNPASHGSHRQHHDGQDHGQHHGQGAPAEQGCCAEADGNGRPDCCDRMGHDQHGTHGGQPAPAGQAPQAHQGH
ncbi:hypothetical protein [Sphingosinicella terrae]|uniref:hypothetical protein n=1 Tax=Sphingosinicella terrae TaxID=2172047 RepID=UPI000E0D37EB|nr:hypothetical protein [Sphingosinicella terrae]